MVFVVAVDCSMEIPYVVDKEECNSEEERDDGEFPEMQRLMSSLVGGQREQDIREQHFEYQTDVSHIYDDMVRGR